MRAAICDLCHDDLDLFLNQDSDIYGSIEKDTSRDTVILSIRIKQITVSDDNIVILYPNNNWAIIPIPSDHYFKIEVM